MGHPKKHPHAQERRMGHPAKGEVGEGQNRATLTRTPAQLGSLLGAESVRAVLLDHLVVDTQD
jgi:hypothetical protein